MGAKQAQKKSFESSAIAEAHFYEAFARLDAGLMSEVWLDSEATFCVHPGGAPLVGVQAVLDSWRGMFHGARPLVLFYKVVRKQVSENMALHLVEEKLSSEDGSQGGMVMASNCYLRTETGWRLLSHHGSPMSRAGTHSAEAPTRMH